MAQNYLGSNNLELLYPSGQFGTRLQNGKDASSLGISLLDYLN